jgi:hypothetical protein
MREKEKNIRYGYRITNEHYKSFLVQGRDSVEHKFYEFVSKKRGSGPLCVFSYIEDLEKFLRKMAAHPACPKWLVFKCVYVPDNALGVWKYWSHSVKWNLPKGTQLASAVKIIEDITETEGFLLEIKHWSDNPKQEWGK